ncbi:hypothetical protein QCM80_14825 [Bradyrhizobium sp. SSUT112]|uniref:hypothetical protein n=1 Tax=Bradyrhizobium sp. SSUT112 TaxID=3040604 RepID=UPI00244B8317|nr:hypothetical protein [Bradyrhizobium sp. SSUT112]MDH2351926.1 hypothetical protein [Bradyrhizobium sp. SSUT112]
MSEDAIVDAPTNIAQLKLGAFWDAWRYRGKARPDRTRDGDGLRHRAELVETYCRRGAKKLRRPRNGNQRASLFSQ